MDPSLDAGDAPFWRPRMSTPPWHPGSRDAPPVLCRWTPGIGTPHAAPDRRHLPPPAVRVLGKGRRERSLPLWKQTADDLRAWVGVRGDVTAPELFLSAQGRVMTREELCLRTRRVRAACGPALSFSHRQTGHPACLAHTCAMMILQATGTSAQSRSGWATRICKQRKVSPRRSHGQAGSD